MPLIVYIGLPVTFTKSNFISDDEEGVINICVQLPLSNFTFLRDVTFALQIVGTLSKNTYMHPLDLIFTKIAL